MVRCSVLVAVLSVHTLSLARCSGRSAGHCPVAYGSLLGVRCCFAGTHTVGRSMLGGVGGSHYIFLIASNGDG